MSDEDYVRSLADRQMSLVVEEDFQRDWAEEEYWRNYEGEDE